MSVNIFEKMELLHKLLVLLFLVGCIQCQLEAKDVGDGCVDSKLNKKGVCRLLKDCQTAQEALENKQLPHTCGFSGSIPIVCCIEDDRQDSLLGSFFNTDRTDISESKCSEYSEATKNLLPRVDAIGTNIVNGMNATLGEYPHMAALGYEDGTVIQWNCGGTLISESFVLTAAHCLKHSTFGDVKYVKLGTVDLTKNPRENVYKVAFSLSHPQYEPPRKYHDIALLQLEEDVTFTENIKPACLYRSTDLNPYRLNSLHVSGYGVTSFGGSSLNLLQYVILDLFTQEECDKQYPIFRNRRHLPNGITYDKQLCAGKKNVSQDACQGDSGGPIQIQDYRKRLFRIVGVTSSGKGCGSIGVPGIYTRVSYYVKWIEDIVWP